MAEMEDRARRAELSAAYLRRMSILWIISDVAIASLIILFRDSLQLGDLAYFVGAFIVVSGIVLAIIMPKLPLWGLKRDQRRMESVDQKWNEIEKK